MRTRNESLGSMLDGVFTSIYSFLALYTLISELCGLKNTEKKLVFTHRHVTYACG